MGTKVGEEIKTFVLELTSPISMDGEIRKAGELIEVVEHEAKDLLNRGKAVLHTLENEAVQAAAGTEGHADDTAEAAQGDKAQ